MDNLLDYASLLLAPISSVVTWFVARRQRQIDAIQSMQDTIDELVAKNAELYAMVVALRAENAELRKIITQKISDEELILNKLGK